MDNTWYNDPVLFGQVSRTKPRKNFGLAMPHYTAEEMSDHSQPVDFWDSIFTRGQWSEADEARTAIDGAIIPRQPCVLVRLADHSLKRSTGGRSSMPSGTRCPFTSLKMEWRISIGSISRASAGSPDESTISSDICCKCGERWLTAAISAVIFCGRSSTTWNGPPDTANDLVSCTSTIEPSSEPSRESGHWYRELIRMNRANRP